MSAAPRPTAHPQHTDPGRAYLWVLGLVVVAFALLTYFDLQSDLPYMDEYARQWSLNRLASGRGLALWGQNPAMIQILAAAPLALMHTAARFWRLPQLPFLALLPIYSWKLSRRFGANRFWSSVGAAAMICNPLTLGVATGMMNDTVYLGLLAAGAWFLVCWVGDGNGRVWFMVLASLATAQRLQGLGLVMVLSIGLALRARNRTATRADWIGLAAAWAGSLAAWRLPGLLRTVTTPGSVPQQATGPGFWVYSSIQVPIMLGLFLLPLCVALWSRPDHEAKKSGRHELVPASIGVAGVIASAMLLFVVRGMLFPGIWLAAWGLGPGFLGDIKPDFWPAPLFLAFELLVCATFAVVLLRRRRAWNPTLLGSERVLLLLLAGAQFAPIIAYSATYDRFYLPVLLPVLPVAVSLVTTAPRRAAATWALLSLSALIAVYAVGEQDYVAWQKARDDAAQQAYHSAAPWEVAGGFEEEAVHVWIPATEHPVGAVPRAVLTCPRLFLVWARRGDPRPGADYWSVQPGRIVIQRSRCTTP